MAAPMFLVTGAGSRGRLLQGRRRVRHACSQCADDEGFKAWVVDIQERLKRAEDETGGALLRLSG